MLTTHDTRAPYGKPRYADPTAYAAAIATGDARWSDRYAGPANLEMHAFGLELAEMHSLASICLDGTEPRFPVIAAIPGAPLYGAVTANCTPCARPQLHNSTAEALADVWSHYRSRLACEMDAAECEREELAEAA